MPWFAPAPLGNPRFNPSKPIIYNLSDGTSGQGMMPNNAVVGGTTWAAASDGALSGAALAANLAAGGNGLNGGNNTGPSVTAFNAAVAAGSIYVANTNNAPANTPGRPTRRAPTSPKSMSTQARRPAPRT